MALATALAAGVIAFAVVAWQGVDGWGRYQPMDRDEGPADAAVRATLQDDRIAAPQRYEALFAYFLRGFVEHASADGARVQYPGLASRSGYGVNGLEGFARTAPLLAAWLHSGRGSTFVDRATGRGIDLVALLKRGLLAGTNPRGDGYWGPIGARDQRIVEAADIARVLWLSRKEVWDTLTLAERSRIVAWLRQVDPAATWQNNWRLYPLVVDLVLRDLGHGAQAPPRLASYEAVKAGYLGHGWFRDPPGGVDFYSAWAIAYELYWIRRLQPDFDRAFIAESLREAGALTAHLISPNGVPILGRSVCYRTAVPVPLLAAVDVEGSAITPGLARRGLDAVWRHFVARGALRNGALTQGYHGTDPRVVDGYTGTGSCQWGLRSLVLAWLQPPAAPFWTVPDEPLPVERGDFRLELPALGWSVEGQRDGATIVIHVAGNRGPPRAPAAHSAWRRAAELLLRRPLRPANRPAQYDSPQYSSAQPFPLLPAP